MILKSAVFALFASLTLAPAAFAAQSFDGFVSDSMCGRKHMMPGMSDAQCTQACLKEGSKYVLVAGSKIYTLGAKPEKLAPFAGQHVKVDGTLKGTTLDVQSIRTVAAR
ncbi:hypothetical protein ACOBR2_17310 [Telmatobacter bradus]|uniref:hypothetical protein n=1 Tax=Telmatobacter bradus TaxID=474953 RepID=UPI003B4357D7